MNENRHKVNRQDNKMTKETTIGNRIHNTKQSNGTEVKGWEK